MRLPHYTNNEHRKAIVLHHIVGSEVGEDGIFDESPKAWMASSVTYLDHRLRDILRLV